MLDRGAVGMGASAGTACMVTASHAERMASRAMLLDSRRLIGSVPSAFAGVMSGGMVMNVQSAYADPVPGSQACYFNINAPNDYYCNGTEHNQVTINATGQFIVEIQDNPNPYYQNIDTDGAAFTINAATGTSGKPDVLLYLGFAMLLALTFWSARGYFNRMRYAHIHIGALYWHFVDAVWLAVFFTFYLTPLLGLRS